MSQKFQYVSDTLYTVEDFIDSDFFSLKKIN